MTTKRNEQAPAVGAVGSEPFIDKREVARRLNRTLRTVDNWMQRGLLPYYKIGRGVSFKWSEVEESLRRRFRVGSVED